MRSAPRAIAMLVAAAILTAATGTALADPPGGPHQPVTICHKPSTPAEQELIVDDDAVPGHLGHGDALGPCGAAAPVPAGAPGAGPAQGPQRQAPAGAAPAVVAQPQFNG